MSVQIFLSNYEADFANMNEAYIAAFPKDVPFPVRTCVGVAALPAKTDIEMTIVSPVACKLRGKLKADRCQAGLSEELPPFDGITRSLLQESEIVCGDFARHLADHMQDARGIERCSGLMDRGYESMVTQRMIANWGSSAEASKSTDDFLCMASRRRVMLRAISLRARPLYLPSARECILTHVEQAGRVERTWQAKIQAFIVACGFIAVVKVVSCTSCPRPVRHTLPRRLAHGPAEHTQIHLLKRIGHRAPR